jgi:tetratricopeptide (TPR) repeat protein
LTAALAGIEADPTNPQSYLQAGEAHLGLGDIEAAGQMFARATEIYPRYAFEVEIIREGAWIGAFNEGVDALSADRRPEAFAAFQRANQIYQGRPEAYFEAAAILLDDESRVQEVLNLYELASDAVLARRARGDAESLSAVEEWREYFQVALYNRAHLLFTAKRYADAAEVYLQIIEFFPDDDGVIGAALVSFSESGMVEEYLPVMEALLEREGLSGDHYISLGGAFYGAEKMDFASASFKKLHEMYPQDRNALSNYTLTLYLANKPEELIVAAEKLLAMEPFDQAPYRFLVNAYASSGREADATALLARMEALPFDFAGVNFQPNETGGIFLGQVTNNSRPANSTVNVRLHIVTPDGSTTVTDPVVVTLGAQGEPVPFQVPVTTRAQFVGYRYEVIQ